MDISIDLILSCSIVAIAIVFSMAGCFCCFDFLETTDCEGSGVNPQEKTRSWRDFSLVKGFRGQPNRFA